MAVTTRTLRRHHDYSRILISLAVLAGMVAIAPIVAAAMGYGSSSVSPKTAYATAPAGEYAVVGRSEAQADVIAVGWAQNPGETTEIARVPHLEGFASTGAVSPDGKRLALVTVDGGSRTHPTASLNVVNLDTGQVVEAASHVTANQSPIWAADSSAVIAVRQISGADSPGSIDLLKVRADGKGETRLGGFTSVLGFYPVGFDSSGRLVSVVIGGDGSSLWRDSKRVALVSPNITRDWRLSPDGSTLAYIDVDTSGGVHYLARTYSLDGGGVSAQSLETAVSALGVAWNPATRQPTFGAEPGGSAAGVQAQSLSAGPASGFDVPLAYSGSGGALFVTHWNGTSFAQAGEPDLEMITSDGRASFENFSRFYGWSAR